MVSIDQFLRDRLHEDEAAALATTPVPVPGRWKAARDKHAPDNAPLFLIQGEDEYEPGSEDYSGNSPVIAYSAEWQDEAKANLRHIARHDPARVLAEVKAKRHLVKWCGEVLQRPDWSTATMVLLTLAAVYADHPDYDPAWRMA